MELLVVAVIGGFIGLLIRYLLPGRQHVGILLLPAVGIMVAAAVWALLFVNGFTADNGWMWTISIVAATLVSLLVAQILRVVRPDLDRKRFEQLTAPGA